MAKKVGWMDNKLNETRTEEMRYSAPAFLVAAAKMNDLIWKQPIVDTGTPHAHDCAPRSEPPLIGC